VCQLSDVSARFQVYRPCLRVEHGNGANFVVNHHKIIVLHSNTLTQPYFQLGIALLESNIFHGAIPKTNGEITLQFINFFVGHSRY